MPLINEVLVVIVNWDPNLRCLRQTNAIGIAANWSSPSCNCKPNRIDLTPNPYAELCTCEPESGGYSHYTRINSRGPRRRIL
jgi:hypothetical protein